MKTSAEKIVLYVEDNPVNILLVQAIFEQRKHAQLVTATTGADGLALARQHRPSLILLDLNLPDMNGEDYLRALRSTEEGKETPVVIVSADALGEQRACFQELGIAGYIVKPFQLTHFEEIVDRFLVENS